MATTSRILLAAALLSATTSAGFAESWDLFPGERDPNPVVQQPHTLLLQDRSLYDARLQVPGRARTITPAPFESNFEKFYFDRASQTVEGAGGGQ